MCINRIYYGEEAIISQIERNEEGKRKCFRKKKKRKLKKFLCGRFNKRVL